MADSTSFIDLISSSQSQKEVTANNAFNAASPGLFGARRSSTSAALTWGYYGGRWRGTLVSNGTLALTASSTNYIVVSKATGVVSASTATTNWNDRSRYLRLYLVVTGSATITSWQDHRQAYDEQSFLLVNYQAVSPHTIAATDLGATVEIDQAASAQITLPNNLPVGFHCRVLQAGAGQVQFVADTGATLRNRQSHTKTAGQYAVTNLYVSKNTTLTSAEWVLSGDTST
jgi:hypothetical protein